MADLNRHSSECVIRCSSQPLPGIGHCPNCNRIVNNVIVGQIKPSVDTEETSSAAGGLNRDTLPVCPRNSRGKKPSVVSVWSCLFYGLRLLKR